MTNNQLMKVDHEQAVATVYGGEDALDRVMTMLAPLYPGFDQQTLVLIGRIGLAFGANFLPSSGEIQVWDSWDASSRQYKKTVYLAIKYYRRLIRDAGDEIRWAVQPVNGSMTPQEMQDHGMADNDIGILCAGYLRSSFREARADGWSAPEAERRVMRYGVGRVRYDEMFATTDHYKKGRGGSRQKVRSAGDPMPPPNGRSWRWVGWKRAEMDLLSKLATVVSPLTDRIKAMNDRHLQLLETSTKQAGPRGPVDIDQINADLYGSETSGPVLTAGTQETAVVIEQDPEPDVLIVDQDGEDQEPDQEETAVVTEEAVDPDPDQDGEDQDGEETGIETIDVKSGNFIAFQREGARLFGKHWETKRHESVERMTGGRTSSSKKLTPREFNGLRSKLAAYRRGIVVSADDRRSHINYLIEKDGGDPWSHNDVKTFVERVNGKDQPVNPDALTAAYFAWSSNDRDLDAAAEAYQEATETAAGNFGF